MSKIINTKDGRKIRRISRWIAIKHNYSPNRGNSLWYYVMDGSGYREGNPNFNPHDGLYLDYFRWNGRNWAIEQFYRMDYPEFWEDEDGKLNWLSGYDSENYYNPILIEIDEYCENVRVYEEVRE